MLVILQQRDGAGDCTVTQAVYPWCHNQGNVKQEVLTLGNVKKRLSLNKAIVCLPVQVHTSKTCINRCSLCAFVKHWHSELGREIEAIFW